MTCKLGESMAEADQISIYAQDYDANGDAIYTYSLSDNVVQKLSLNFKDVDVHVVGGASSSYLEMKNFDVHSYTVSLNSGTVTVNGSSGFLSSLIDTSGGGISFKGLRYFFQKKPDPDRPKSVTVYLADNAELTALSVTVKDGTFSMRNVNLPIEDCVVNLTDSSAEFNRVNTEKLAQVTATGGDVKMINSKFVLVDAKVTDGDFIVDGTESLAFQNTDYELKVAETGEIRYNGGYGGVDYKITAPLSAHTYRISVTNGNITIMDGGLAADVPLPDPDVTTAPVD
jgi:hypothetical protein